MLDNQIIIEKLLKLAKKAFQRKEVPVSAVIIHNNKIIAQSYNRREKKKSVCAHAEILAIEKASKKLNRWNLSDCVLFVSLKPCSMCTEVIKQSRLNKVYYLLDKPSFKNEYNKTTFELLKTLNHSNSYQQLLSSFFRNMR